MKKWNNLKYVILFLLIYFAGAFSSAWADKRYYNIHPIDALRSFGNNKNFTDRTLTNALRSLNSSKENVWFFLQPGLWEIRDSVTVPANVTLIIPSGAILNIGDRLTLTINGPVKAGYYQIFSGKGMVKIGNQIESVSPQWWKEDDQKYYNDAIQKALESGAGTVFLPAKIYDISISDSKNYALKVLSNTTIKGESKKSILRLREVPQTKGIWDASDILISKNSEALSIEGVTFDSSDFYPDPEITSRQDLTIKGTRAINFSSARKCVIRNCLFKGFTTSSIVINGIDLRIEYNNFINGSYRAQILRLDGSKNVTVIDNVFEDNGPHHYMILGRPLETSSTDAIMVGYKVGSFRNECG